MNLKETIKHYEDLADYDCYTDEQREKSKEYNRVAEYLRLLERSHTLLKATHDLLSKQKSNIYVLNLLNETVHYDEAECDGSCLMNDIEAWYFEFMNPIS